MPWKECHVMDERGRFVARLLDGEKMARLCAEFGISRKTGYKIFERYQRLGVRGLTDRSRRPYRYANQLPPAVETLIVRLKREYPSWGAPKIRERVRQKWPEIPCPADGHHVDADHPCRTACGAQTTKASSYSATTDTAIR